MENNITESKIIKYPNPILKKKSQEVKEITKEVKELTKIMMEEMERKQGIGLAAPQLGVLKRIIVVNFNDEQQVYINPIIINKSRETNINEEGCLSIPDFFANIKRADSIKVKALNLRGEEIIFNAEELLARALQHEIDHLNGILFIDRLGFLKRLKAKNLIRKKLNNK